MEWKQRLKRAQLTNRSVSINQKTSNRWSQINTATQIEEKRRLYLAGLSDGLMPRNDEADLGCEQGLLTTDLNMEMAGFEKDRHREAIIADNGNGCNAEKSSESRLTASNESGGVFRDILNDPVPVKI